MVCPLNAVTVYPWHTDGTSVSFTAVCTITAIRKNVCTLMLSFYDDLYKAILERIRATARLLQDDEAFYRLAEEKSGLNTSEKQLVAECDKLKRRQRELSALLFKLFDEHAARTDIRCKLCFVHKQIPVRADRRPRQNCCIGYEVRTAD